MRDQQLASRSMKLGARAANRHQPPSDKRAWQGDDECFGLASKKLPQIYCHLFAWPDLAPPRLVLDLNKHVAVQLRVDARCMSCK